VDAIAVRPRDVAEVVVEGLKDVRQPVKLRLGLVASAAGGYRLDLGIGIREVDAHRRLLLDPVAIHVDGPEQVLGKAGSTGAGSFGIRKFRKMESLSQPAFV